jgi:hypothetical protein
MNEPNLEEKCIESIQELLKKYENNKYMLQRIHNNVVNYLPNILENDLKNHEKRIDRATYLTNEQQLFIQIFLSKNKYFYLPNNNCFYEYNGKNYFIVKDDDIIYKLLSSISKDRVLLQWKYKTKINIIKQIKERSLLTSIPETETIQNVLNIIYPSIFSTKNQAKYFLTIIGDNILKKKQDLIFLVTPQTKKILVEIDNIAYISIGSANTTHNFMTKYHENHSYDNCRLIKINEKFCIDIWKDLFKKIGLDLVCVAAHYSNRYENSDNFLDTKADEELKIYANYLKNTNQHEIINKFCNKCLHVINDDTACSAKIEWKNLHFIWKQFLSSCNLPNMIYSNTLKTCLKTIYNYVEETDSFIGITSKYLPIESDFIKFWETNIISSSDEELELDEICMLFKYWVKQNLGQTENEIVFLSNGNISEENVLKILKHFFPNIEIMEDKYILNVNCVLWNKTKDIIKSFEFIKNELKTEVKNNEHLSLISFEDAYNYYFNFCNSKSYKFIISKRYFEKYLYTTIHEHIVYDKFIETCWLLNN